MSWSPEAGRLCKCLWLVKVMPFGVSSESSQEVNNRENKDIKL